MVAAAACAKVRTHMEGLNVSYELVKKAVRFVCLLVQAWYGGTAGAVLGTTLLGVGAVQ